MDNKILPILSLVLSITAIAMFAFMAGEDTKVEVKETNLGALVGPNIYSDVNVYGTLGYKQKTESIAPTSIYATTTIVAEDSGTNFMLSASGTTMILPAVGYAGATYRFTVGGALDTGNVIIDSAEGDNIEGTLVVAGAVVDCASVDQINFVVDGENVGDTVELFSDGTQWLISDSNVLTASKMTCTDPS
jgi:hypothetical protein